MPKKYIILRSESEIELEVVNTAADLAESQDAHSDDPEENDVMILQVTSEEDIVLSRVTVSIEEI